MIQEYVNIVDHIQTAIDPLTAIAIGSSLVKGIGGAIQSIGAGKRLRRLKDPGYQIPKEFETNLGQAEQLARVGMPSEQYNLASTNIQRGTQAGLRQLSRMSNPFAGIAGVARSQSDALANLDAANAAARRQNILGAMGARSQLAQQKLAQQQYAQQRYMDQFNQAQAQMGAGLQNVFGGISGIGNVAMMSQMYGGQNAPKTMGDKYGMGELPRATSVGVSNVGIPQANVNLFKPQPFGLRNQGMPSTTNMIPFPR